MDTTTTGREYLRVSMDRSGRARSVDEQHDDNQQAARGRGVTLAEPYVDNSVSASRYTSKVRGDFNRLLGDLASGRFDAEELWLWEHSRGSRRVSEWVQLIEACEQAGVHIYVTTHGRAYAPANGRDRRSLLEDAVDSEYESSKVSVRSKRAAAANAAAGLPHGPTPYGYQRIYDPLTKRLVRQEPHPEEAPVVRELFDRLRRGHSLRGIAADFAARGIGTRARERDGVMVPGKPFSAQHLRSMALTPVYIGLRIHAPGQVGGHRHDLTGAVKGIWEPLVTEETFYGVRRMLNSPERKTTRPGRARHLLSLIAKCGECGGPLAVTRRADRARPAQVGEERYQCNTKGCVRVNKAELDALAEDAILGYLSGPDVYEPLAVAEHGDDRLQQVRGDLGKARAELDDLRTAVVAGRLSVANLTAVEPGLLTRVTTLEDDERELATPSALRRLLDPGEDIRLTWKDKDIAVQRAVARIVLSRDLVGELRVIRRPRNAGNRRTPADQRVLWVR